MSSTEHISPIPEKIRIPNQQQRDQQPRLQPRRQQQIKNNAKIFVLINISNVLLAVHLAIAIVSQNAAEIILIVLMLAHQNKPFLRHVWNIHKYKCLLCIE